MEYDHNVYLQQVGLKKLGFKVGSLDGLEGSKTCAARAASLKARFGSEKKAALSLDGYAPPPKPTAAARTSVFGRHGTKGGSSPSMSYFTPPWAMTFSWGGKVSRIGCNKVVALPMENAMKEILATYGAAWIKKHGLDVYAGCYNPRKGRGGNAWSDHAWAVAFDFADGRNGNKLHDRWTAAVQGKNGFAMPNGAVTIFRKHGFQVGFKTGTTTRRDMMHVAYIDRP